MRSSLNMVGDDETNFRNRQVKNLPKDFANKSSTDNNLSKTKLSKMVQSEDFLVDVLVHY